jgi:hypothetical protein
MKYFLESIYFNIKEKENFLYFYIYISANSFAQGLSLKVDYKE